MADLKISEKVAQSLNAVATVFRKMDDETRIAYMMRFCMECFSNSHEWQLFLSTLSMNSEGASWDATEPTPFTAGELKAYNKGNSISVIPKKVSEGDLAIITRKNLINPRDANVITNQLTENAELLVAINQIVRNSDKQLMYVVGVLAVSNNASTLRKYKDAFPCTFTINEDQNITIMTKPPKNFRKNFRVLTVNGQPAIVDQNFSEKKSGSRINHKGALGRFMKEIGHVMGQDSILGAIASGKFIRK